jgi:ubiquinone/menaquinone biosynthesis C-methylase UbiE
MQSKNKIKVMMKEIIPGPFVNFMRNYVLKRPSKRMLENLFDLFVSPFRNLIYRSKLDSLKKNGQLSENDLYSSFKGISDNFWYWLFTKGYSDKPFLKGMLPKMPEENIQLQFTGGSGFNTLKEAFFFYLFIKRTAEKRGSVINAETRILDYGCGWGRVIRFFLKDAHPSNLFGIDCDEEIINVCKASDLRCNFEVNNISPPTVFADNFFDLIYTYSVFSHLSEHAHKQWIKEFNRILKPGGILIATTRDRDFIITCAKVREMKKNEIPFFAKGLASAFVNTSECLKEYNDGKYVYEPVGGGGIRNGSFYGETCIPPRYVQTEWKKYFSSLDFINYKKHQYFNQNAIIAQK